MPTAGSLLDCWPGWPLELGPSWRASVQVTGRTDLVCCILRPKSNKMARCASDFTPLLKIMARLRIPVVVDEPWAFQDVTAHACAVGVRACDSPPHKLARTDRPVARRWAGHADVMPNRALLPSSAAARSLMRCSTDAEGLRLLCEPRLLLHTPWHRPPRSAASCGCAAAASCHSLPCLRRRCWKSTGSKTSCRWSASPRRCRPAAGAG